MDFSGYVPPEFIVFVVVVLALVGFITWDWIIPFVSNHVSIH
jgi:hypothetical protein